MGKRLGGKKERPKKKKLPTCHHEWYEEHIKEDCKSFFCLNPDCSDYWHRNDPSRYNHPWDRHNFCMNGYEGEKYLWRGVLEYVVEWEQRTCINCWEVRKTNLTNPLDRRRTWRKRYIRSWKPRTAYRKP